MTRLLTALLIALLLIPSSGIPRSALAQAQDNPVGGPSAQVNCENFLSQADAVAVYDAAGTPDDPDPYTLDGNRGTPGVPCETESEFGTGALASCANFKTQAHAQALYNVAEPGDYPLDANDDGRACSPDEAPPSDLPPTEPDPRAPRPAPTTGCDSTLVSNGRVTVCAGQYIETRPFDFDAFAASAQDGFGRFSGAGSSGPISIGVPSGVTTGGASGSSGTTTTSFQQQSANDGGRVLTSEQKVRKKSKKKLKAKAKKKHKRGKDGKRQRDRTKARQ